MKPAIKKNWQDIQKRYDYPVNAIGVKKDKMTLKIWQEEGIDKFLEK